MDLITKFSEESLPLLKNLTSLNLAGNGLMSDSISILLKEGVSKLEKLKDLNIVRPGGRLRRFPLDIGTINGVSGDKKYNDLFYSFVSFLTPGTIFRVDVTKVNSS